ncbi:ATP-binding protein [Aquimarina sp. ERC-38]|uniref:tetratricopeptide repeat-containing hybrid sensor histidine kinase/response regulator n=1 Tax=Aquimarina sp. ERC-38 TaxID=2949996 RepID=UPI0022468DAF|nr:ATP-binding protein [Aquimarina sp. ERC-38]UZO79711.1 ATP-binding protein [Aquimarina sp. ERC-38]
MEADSIQTYIQRAEVLLKEYKYESALETAEAALQNALYHNDNSNLGYISNILAKIYELNEEDTKAITEYKRGITYASTVKDIGLKSDLYNNLANLIIKKPEHRGEGVKFYIDAYQLAERLEDTARMVKPLLNLGDYYISKDLYLESYEHLKVAKELINEHSPILYQTKLNILLGKYFLSIRRFERSNKYIDKGISMALSQSKNKANSTELLYTYYWELASAYKAKSDLYSKQNEFEQAYNYLLEYQSNFTRASKLKKEIELQRATIQFEVGQFKKQIKQNEVEKDERAEEEIKWHISIILGVVIILISLAFLINAYKNNTQKKKLNKDLIEKNAELKAAKETAEQVSTLKSQFISTVSHELRTPLYGVIGLTSLLMEHPEEKKRYEYLESLKFSGDYLLALINDVLQLSKIETNEVTLEKVSFDLRTLIEGISNSLQSKQKHNNNNLHIQIDPAITSMLYGDSIRLSQILINLVGNSLKFTKNGNIWIKVDQLASSDHDCKLRFVIKDDGIGIPKDKQKNIFENFAQVKNGTQEFEGTGLGLAIVKKLIHLHNSEIEIESEEGKGAEFTFTIVYELAKKKGSSDTYDEDIVQEEDLSIGTTTFNILIVDDNKINQIVTQNILKKKEYTCDVASNGSDAIDLVRVNDYDLILMDINMPEMNGLDATKVIRTFNPYIPIIALTAVEEGEVRDQALSVGMNDVIIKPYDTQQFFQTILKNISHSQVKKVR